MKNKFIKKTGKMPSNGRVTIPVSLRAIVGLYNDTEYEISVNDDKEIVIKKIKNNDK